MSVNKPIGQKSCQSAEAESVCPAWRAPAPLQPLLSYPPLSRLEQGSAFESGFCRRWIFVSRSQERKRDKKKGGGRERGGGREGEKRERERESEGVMYSETAAAHPTRTFNGPGNFLSPCGAASLKMGAARDTQSGGQKR